MKAVVINNVTKYYGYGFNRVRALNQISLDIEEGSMVAITGTSGSGKSTLLHVMGGLEKPEIGEVYLENKNVYRLNNEQLTVLRRRRIGFIFQFYNLVPTINVYENIVLPIHLDGQKEDKAYIDELLDMLGLTDKKYNYIDELSGGQQQRVAIARALASKPAIILADEPTGNLDSVNSQEVLDVLRKSQRKYNQTIIMVTHDAKIASYADRIIRIEDGQILGERYEK